MSQTGPTGLAKAMLADRLRYPGLLPAEVLVLKAWLALHETEYDRFEFNMRLGTGLDPGPSYQPEIRAQAIANSQKRLDAVGFQANQATIIEAKRRGTSSNIGQLELYRHLWLTTYPDAPTPIMILATTAVQTDIVTFAQAMRIQIDFLTVDFSPLRRPGGPLSGHKHNTAVNVPPIRP